MEALRESAVSKLGGIALPAMIKSNFAVENGFTAAELFLNKQGLILL